MQHATAGPASQGHVTPERLMQFAFGYAPPLMIEAAVRIGIFDALADGPRTLEEVVGKTDASERGLRALMDGLVGLELLARLPDGRYALSPESEAFLVSGRPGSHAGFFRHVSTRLLPDWMHLTEAVRTGLPPIAVNREEDGSQFFHDFVEDIFPLSYKAAQALATALQVPLADSPVSVLDLAAGSGVWGIALAQQSPQVRVTAVDWAGVLPVTRKMAERFGLGDRFRFVEGDLHEADFGGGHQIATLGHILHSEGEQKSRTLLRKTFAALAPGGTIAIAEWLPNEERTGPPRALIFAINMLVHTDVGDTFTFGEIAGWLKEAGFENTRTLEAPGPSPLILADRPAA
jgi:ubiquinone/menaquinone biosynthesis C-methylase UbiE